MAARAKKTRARGDEYPTDAMLGALVDEAEVAAEVVLDAVELAPELVLEAEDELDELDTVVVELCALELELIVLSDEDEDEVWDVETELVEEPDKEPDEVAADEADEELATPPINWNCSL